MKLKYLFNISEYDFEMTLCEVVWDGYMICIPFQLCFTGGLGSPQVTVDKAFKVSGVGYLCGPYLFHFGIDVVQVVLECLMRLQGERRIMIYMFS